MVLHNISPIPFAVFIFYFLLYLKSPTGSIKKADQKQPLTVTEKHISYHRDISIKDDNIQLMDFLLCISRTGS